MSLYVLDTDTLTILQHKQPEVCARAARHADELATTIISVEEQVSGWYREVRKARKPDQLARAYQRFTESITALSKLCVLTLSEMAINRYSDWQRQKLKVRKMDLRIAAIVLEHGATLVTRNVQDFGRVPGLRIENWTKPG